MPTLRDPWKIGNVVVPNRVVLAPLAGIGNWFVRLQAKRFGAGYAVSEMVSSHAIHYGNRKTLDELLVVRPEEKHDGPVAIQLFGQDPEVMRGAAAPRMTSGSWPKSWMATGPASFSSGRTTSSSSSVLRFS